MNCEENVEKGWGCDEDNCNVCSGPQYGLTSCENKLEDKKNRNNFYQGDSGAP
jgi:hypothetical protein